MRFKVRSLFSLLISLLAGIVTLLNSVLIARYLSIEDYGFFSLATTIIFIFIQFSDLGLNDTIIKKSNIIQRDKSSVKTIYSLNSLYSLIASLFMLLLIPVFSTFYGEKIVPLLTIGSFFVFFGSQFLFIKRLFLAFKRPDIFSLLKLLDPFIKLLVNLIFILSGGLNSTLALFSAAFSETILTFGVLSFGIWDYLKVSYKRLSYLKKIIIDALPFSFVPIITFISAYINELIIGYFVDIPNVGFYNIGKFPYKVLTFIIPIFSSTLIPLFNEKKENSRVINISLKYFYMLLIPLISVFFIKAKTIILFLFGSKYVVAEPYFKMLSINMLQVGITNILFAYYFSKAKPTSILKYNIVISVIQIAIGFVLVYLFGVNGAVASDMLIKTISIMILYSYTKKGINLSKLIKILLISILALPLLLMVSFKKLILDLVVAPSLYFLITFLLYLAFKETDIKEWF